MRVVQKLRQILNRGEADAIAEHRGESIPEGIVEGLCPPNKAVQQYGGNTQRNQGHQTIRVSSQEDEQGDNRLNLNDRFEGISLDEAYEKAKLLEQLCKAADAYRADEEMEYFEPGYALGAVLSGLLYEVTESLFEGGERHPEQLEAFLNGFYGTFQHWKRCYHK